MTKSIEELQREKIELEIHDLKKQWYKRKDYLQILLPTTLAIFSLIYAIVTGFFSTKYDHLQLQKEQLKLEILLFENRKQDLMKSNVLLTNSNDSLIKSLNKERIFLSNYKIEFSKKVNEINEKEMQLIGLKAEKIKYEIEISQLQKAYQNKKALLEGELEKQYYNETDLKNKMGELEGIINQQRSEINRLNHKVGLINSNPYIDKNSMNEFKIWILDQDRKYLESEIKKSDKQTEKLYEQHIKEKNRLDSLNSKLKVIELDLK